MEMHTLEITPEIRSLPLLYEFCEKLGVDARLMLALEEAFANVANHAGATHVEVRGSRSENAWVFEMEDNGIPFDATAFEDYGPEKDAALKTGGQGIRIMRAMSDSLSYRRKMGKNILTIIKTDKN